MSERAYYGDSIYVEISDQGDVILTTENGFGPTNTIIFEYGTFGQLAPFVARLFRKLDARNEYEHQENG